jgi:hypothetical protein
MGEVLMVIAAVVAVIGVLLLASVIRRTPIVGRGEMPEPGEPRPGPAPLGPAAQSLPAPDPITVSMTERPSGIIRIGGPTVVKKVVVRKITVSGQPAKESITVDGVEYHSVDDIQDPKLREQIRAALHGAAAQVDDPQLREKVEQELADLGIRDDPNGSGGAEPAG